MAEFTDSPLPPEPIEKALNSKFLSKKAVDGVLILSLRRVVLQLVQTGSNIVLARLLAPKDFGEYAIIIFGISLFTLFADLGLSGALIQSDKEPTERQLQSIFWTQTALGLLATLLMIGSIPFFSHFYKRELESNGLNLIAISSVAIFLFNFNQIPYSMIQRQMQFGRMLLGEFTELIIQQIITIYFAWNGYGVASFVYGLIVGRLLAAPIYFLLSPWKISIHFDFADLKSFLKFGLPFQVSNLVGNINGAVTPIVVGGLSGSKGLGLVNWAGGVGALPVSVSDVLGKVIFQVGSRAQKKKALLKSTIEASIHLNNLITFPMIALTIALARPITTILFTDKWAEGIPALYLFSLESVFSGIGHILIFALLALGYSATIRNINILTSGLIWLIAIPLVSYYGFTGLAIAHLLSSLVLLKTYNEVKKYIKIDIAEYTLPYLILATISGILTYLYSIEFPIIGVFQLILTCIFSILIYLFLVLIFCQSLIQKESSVLFKRFAQLQKKLNYFKN